MATTTITDLPSSRALDYKAMSAIRGALRDGSWVFTIPAWPESARIINFYQTNYIADQLIFQTQNINVKNSGPGATITVGAAQDASQNALNLNIIHVAPALPHP